MKGLLLSFSMFSIAPVPSAGPVDRSVTGAALRWLPFVGALLGAVAGCGALVFWRGHGHGSAFVGAVVIVMLMAVGTRGLHLDGLSDLADGLGSRKPAADALAIMRQSDIGPFGVATLLFVVLVDVAAWSTVLDGAGRWAVVVQAAAVGAVSRLAVVFAAGPEFPAAGGSSFGVLVTGTASWLVRIGCAAAVFAAGGLLEWAAGVSGVALGGSLGAAVIALIGGYALAVHARRRLGGVSGDVFGAIAEVAGASYLLVLAAVVTWHGSL